MKYLKSLSIAATLAASIAIPATADTELTMYYSIAVGSRAVVKARPVLGSPSWSS